MSELREQAELQRMVADSAKLQQETNKFVAEAHKLEAERRKLDRERWWLPLATVTGAMTAGAAIVGATLLLVKYFGAAG
jgi:hypothetical protein